MSSNPIVIFATAYFPLVGGAEVALKEITDRLPNGNIHVITAKIRPGLASRERWGNAEVHRVGFGHPIDKLLLPFVAPVVAWWLQRGVKRPVAWALMASYGGFGALFYALLRPSARLLLTLQEGDPLEYIERRVGVLFPIFKKIFFRADAIQAISHFLADWAVRMGARVTPRVVPNGVDIARFRVPLAAQERLHARASLGYAPNDTVVITTSRLTKKNGIADVIRALPMLAPEVKFLIVGEGEDGESLMRLAEELGVSSRTQFLGRRDHAELPALLRASDIFIRASLSEGLGNSFLEAMAADLPIIGTPVGGIPDFLVDGETGVFCQPHDPVSVARAVERLRNSPDLVQRLKDCGPILVKEKYAWEDIAREMGEILEGLEASPASPEKGV